MNSNVAAGAQGDPQFAWDAVARIMMSRRAYRRCLYMLHFNLSIVTCVERVYSIVGGLNCHSGTMPEADRVHLSRAAPALFVTWRTFAIQGMMEKRHFRMCCSVGLAVACIRFAPGDYVTISPKG